MSDYKVEVSEKLKKILHKLLRKDKTRYEATIKKIHEVARAIDPHHYKNLAHDMSAFKRVHIDSHFVLIFKVDDNLKTIKFEDLQHHDHIYD